MAQPERREDFLLVPVPLPSELHLPMAMVLYRGHRTLSVEPNPSLLPLLNLPF